MPQIVVSAADLSALVEKGQAVAQKIAEGIETLQSQLTQLQAMRESARIGSIVHSVAQEQVGVTEAGIESLQTLQSGNHVYASMLERLQASTEGLDGAQLNPRLAQATLQSVRRLMAAEDQVNFANVGDPVRASTLLEQYAAESANEAQSGATKLADLTESELSALDNYEDPMDAADFDMDAFLDDMADEGVATPPAGPAITEIVAGSEAAATVASSVTAANAAAVIGGTAVVVVTAAAIAEGVAQSLIAKQKPPAKAPSLPSKLAATYPGRVQERYENASWDELAQYFHEGKAAPGSARLRRHFFADGYLDIQTFQPAFTRSDRTAAAGLDARQDAAIQNYTARFYRFGKPSDRPQLQPLEVGQPLYFYGLKESTNVNKPVHVDGGKIDVTGWTNFADQRQDYRWYTGQAETTVARKPATLPLEPLAPAHLGADALVQSMATLPSPAAAATAPPAAHKASMLLALTPGSSGASANLPEEFK